MITHILKKLALVGLFLTACSDAKKVVSLDGKFDAYKESFFESFWKLHPGWASSVGYHAYDSILSVPDQRRRDTELNFYHAQLDSLNRLDPASLNANNKTDLFILRDFFNSAIWGITTLKSYQWNPSNYNVCEGFAEMLNNNYDSLDLRLKNFYIKMQSVQAYYEAAKQNIRNPTREHSDLAASQNEGGTSVFTDDLEAALDKSNLSGEEKGKIRERASQAVKTIRDYAKWLKDLPHENPRSFRLGKDLYMQKFENDIRSRYKADEIYEMAKRHKVELHGKMNAITRQLWPKYFKTQVPADSLLAIRNLIDHLSANHVKPDSFQAAIEKQIPRLVEFINSKNLLYLDPSKPLVVRREPAYMAGLAGASISSPGPYDKNGNTYYNVGSLSGWSPDKAESYLREYNHYILQILNIHEAIPGHYTQLIYSNRSPSLVKSVFGNGAMVEGWAVYTELMMLENGYGARDGETTADPEMWLMYYKWNLRSTCNTILDYGVHVNDLGRDEAINMLVNEAFQQQAEAEGKWRRVTLSQVQLCSYFTGYTEIYNLREEIKKRMGAKFNLKEFHEKFLSYGSAPVKYIREAMLADL
jgi:hypothetical protein